MSQDTLETEVTIKAGDFWHVPFNAKKGNVLHIVVRENYDYDFGIYIVPAEDVTDDVFWPNHALLSIESETYYRGSYDFELDGSYCLVVDNTHARSVPREVYIKLDLVPAEEPGAIARSLHPSPSAQLQLRQPPAIQRLIVIVGLVVLALIVSLAYIVHIGLGAAVTFLAGVLVKVYLTQIRRALDQNYDGAVAAKS